VNRPRTFVEKTVVARALTKVNDANSDPLGTPTTRK
jgi:hypothetical protein